MVIPITAFPINYLKVYRCQEALERLRSQAPTCWRCTAGYGIPDHARAASCDRHSVVLFYQGDLEQDQVVYFDIPVPLCLTECNHGVRRLTVTVAYSPDVQRQGLQRYLGTEVKWRLFRGDVDREAIVSFMSSEGGDDDSTAGSENPGELSGEYKIRLRSKGTVQHDVFEWHEHRASFSASNYTLAIASYEKWKRTRAEPVPYAVVVRLEDRSLTAPVYSEVARVIARAQVQIRA